MEVDVTRLEAIKALYKELLHREADAPGLQSYYESGSPIDQIRASIESSDERRSILRKESRGEVVAEDIEPWLYLGDCPFKAEEEKLKQEGITHILDISDFDDEEGYKPESFKEVLKIPVPDNAVITTQDTVNALKFIKKIDELSNEEDVKLLVCGKTGFDKAPAVMVLWYIAGGMDTEAACIYMMSRIPGVNLDASAIGPWHIDAAKTAFVEESK